MKKLFLLFPVLLILSIHSNAQDIKLNCSTVLKSYLNGQLNESKQGPLIVEISEYRNKEIIIFVSGIYEISVSTPQDNGRVVTNYSNSNVWNISNSFSAMKSFPLIKSRTVNLRIDRDIGTINISHTTYYTNNNYSEELVSGNCSKVDTTKRKF